MVRVAFLHGPKNARLDARGIVSGTERPNHIRRVQELAKGLLRRLARASGYHGRAFASASLVETMSRIFALRLRQEMRR
jgi:hypothetical protein